MERGRDVETERQKEREGAGLGMRTVCSVRAIEDKVIQGLLSCLVGCY